MTCDCKQWWVYIIQCEPEALYTGISLDVQRRFSEHLATYNKHPKAKGAKFFRRYKPLSVVYREPYGSRSEATRREKAIKSLSRAGKKQLLKAAINSNLSRDAAEAV